jgi:carboxypeptidase PM20D1
MMAKSEGRQRTWREQARRTALVLLAVAALVLSGALFWRAYATTEAARPELVTIARGVDMGAAVQRLGEALRAQTVSHGEAPPSVAFEQLRQLLRRSFPRVHASLHLETVNEHSLLYTWPGIDERAPGVLLMAHQDVVPAADEQGRWKHPPFAGTVAEGFVWGRGAWDDKGRLMAQLEAVESLLEQGVQPSRTVYLAFGHDEEVGGAQGAKAIAELLHSRGVRLQFVLDEGLVVTDGVIAGAQRPVALIGVAEKGYATLRVRATGDAGHSSMPPSRTAIGQLSRALAAIDEHPMPARLAGVAADMFSTLAPEMGATRRVMLANLWLFGPLVQRALEKTPSSNAMLRTTTALTVVRGGLAPNVLPGSAEALVNYRLLPQDSAQDVLAHVQQIVAPHQVDVELLPGGSAASPISPIDAPAYRLIRASLWEAFGDVAVAPGLLVGGTDARYMTRLTDHVYRFSPVRARPDDLARIHGDNERLSVRNYEEMIVFYQRLLTRAVIE